MILTIFITSFMAQLTNALDTQSVGRGFKPHP